MIANPAVVAAWDGPSALRKFTVSGLCGHLARATLAVDEYLDLPEPAGPAVATAADYFAALPLDDIDSDLNAGIRRRGDAAAAAGHSAIITKLQQAQRRLGTRLQSEPPGRMMRVFGEQAMRLDDYLATRLVELALHVDDVCVSVGIDTPPVPGAGTAITTLVEVARKRSGDIAVLRALGRRERDPAAALRVL